MTIYVIRHASAGRRGAGSQDWLRPLDDTGREQAQRISDLLAHDSVSRVLSSPSLRCQQTVQPLAVRLGLEVEVAEDLDEGQSAQRARTLVHQLAAAETTAVLCSHGDIIPALLDLLGDEGVELSGSGCAKGGLWTLQVDTGRVTAGSYLARP